MHVLVFVKRVATKKCREWDLINTDSKEDEEFNTGQIIVAVGIGKEKIIL